MTSLVKNSALVTSNEMIAQDIYKLCLFCKDAFKEAKAGQFVNVYTDNACLLLPRPISICDSTNDTLTLVFKVVGEGTKLFSGLKTGDRVDVSTSLGNSFDTSFLKEGDTVLLAGGGVGIPPMLNLAKKCKAEGLKTIAVLGFRDEPFLIEEFEKAGSEVHICTDLGTFGFHGNVVQFLKSEGIAADAAFACGPKIMLKFFTEYTKEKAIPTFISMEERMGCGYGACVGCAIDLNINGEVVRKKVCKDGPVFKAEEVIF